MSKETIYSRIKALEDTSSTKLDLNYTLNEINNNKEALVNSIDTGITTEFESPYLAHTLNKSYIYGGSNVRVITNAEGIIDAFTVDVYRIKAGDTFIIGGGQVRLAGNYPGVAFFTTDDNYSYGTIILNVTTTPTNYYYEYTATEDGVLAIAKHSSYNQLQIYKIVQRPKKIYSSASEITWQNGYQNSSGVINSYGTYQVTNFIPVKTGQRIRAVGFLGVGGTAAAVPACFFDIFGVFIASVSTMHTVDVVVDSTLSENYTRIAFVRFCNDNALSAIHTEIESFSKVRDLSGKNVYILGDSIAYLSGSWAFNLANLTGARKIYNLARGGATWADRANIITYDDSCSIWSNDFAYNTSADGKTESYPSNTNMTSAVPPVDNSNYTCVSNEIRFMNRLIEEFGRPEPDIIIISCGVNDTRSNTQSYDESTFNSIITTSLSDMTAASKKTLGGGIRYCIETLMENYPHAQIIIATPIHCAYEYIRPYLENTNKWIKAFHVYYSTKLIDAYSESGISMAFEKGWGDMSYKESNAGRYLYDGLHPNPAGKIVMSNYYANEVLHKAVCKY